jgi:Relaxase/Mobilisation nuclease domain
MITKIKANKSFRGTTKYVLEKEQANIIGGNMYGSTTDKLVEQFTLSAHLNPQLKDPCYHLMLSVPKTDRSLNDDELANLSQRHLANVIVLSRLKGEEAQVKQPDKRISDTKLNQLVDEFIETELPAYDFFIARHSDKKHDHTHIVASRVNNLDGKSIRTWNNYAYSEHSARLLEREFNLTPVQSSWESKRKAMTRNQLERVERDGLPGEEIMRRAIEQVAVNKPTMPEFIERLWSEHQVKAVVSYYSHGGVRGIKFGIDVGSVNEDGSPRLLWKQGGNLNKYKCSFTKLQTELGISYDPQRDDNEIKRLNNFLESVPNEPNNQQVIPKISADNSPVLAEINPQIYPTSSELYQPDSVALPLVAQSEKRQLSQKAINAIAEFIDSSSVESVLGEALPSVNQSLDQYQQSLASVTTTFNQLLTALTQAEKSQLFPKSISAIAEFIEQSSIESALVELPPVLKELSEFQSDTIIEPLSQIVEQLKQLSKLLPSQSGNLSTDKPKLKDELRAELYKYYSADLHSLLVIDRDKEIAFRALLDNKPARYVEEILLASPAGWNEEEAKALVLIAESQVVKKQLAPVPQQAEQQQLRRELLSIAVPVGVELINRLLKGTGRNSLKFKHSTVSKQDKELVFTHDERGEVFRVQVNRNSQGEIEYSVVNIGEIKQSDIETWQKAEQILVEYLKHKQQQSMTRNRGLSR